MFRKLRSLICSLPNAETEANKFFSSPLHHLSWEQIKEIVVLIVDEARISRDFGLYIENRHIEKEEAFFLALINGLGGIPRMRREIPFEKAQEIVSKLMGEYFLDDLRYYFEHNKKGEVRNGYNAHLESVKNRLLRKIYSEHFKSGMLVNASEGQ